MDLKTYSSIPQALWAYYQELLAKNPSHPIVAAIQRQGEEQTWQGINELFLITAQNTGLFDKLLRLLGFDEKNLDPNHLQAIFGVMRTINTLHNLAFDNILPLPPKKSQRESDLLAEHKGMRFAVEVFRSSEMAYRFPDHTNSAQNLQSYIARRYKEKRSQLDATMKARQCNKALLAVVMDSQPAKALVADTEWEAVVKDTFEQMGGPTNTHLSSSLA